MSQFFGKPLPFWETSSAEEIFKYLVEDALLEEHFVGPIVWLRNNRPDVANRVLCFYYEVACYNVGESCFKESSPEADHDKWFVSTLATANFKSDEIPLANSREEAEALAVEKLGLLNLYLTPQACEA